MRATTMNIILIGLLAASLATPSFAQAGSSKTVTAATSDTRTEKMTSYGAGVKSKARMPLAQAVAEKKFNTSIALTATVAEVCQVKGCWMILLDGDTKVRVTFKDYGFFMPKDLAGAKVVVEGVDAGLAIAKPGSARRMPATTLKMQASRRLRSRRSRVISANWVLKLRAYSRRRSDRCAAIVGSRYRSTDLAW